MKRYFHPPVLRPPWEMELRIEETRLDQLTELYERVGPTSRLADFEIRRHGQPVLVLRGAPEVEFREPGLSELHDLCGDLTDVEHLRTFMDAVRVAVDLDTPLEVVAAVRRALRSLDAGRRLQ